MTPTATPSVVEPPHADAAPTPARPRPRAPRARPAPPAAYAAGLDVGYAYVKWLDQTGARLCLPTAVAPVDLDTTPTGTLRPGDFLARIDDAPYLVGQGAIWSGRRLTDHLRWDTWWQSIPYRAVLQALAAQVPPGGIIVTGVPLSVPLTTAITAPIERTLTAALRARQVLVTQQGAAAAVALDLFQADGQFAVIDIGGRTTELLTIRYGQIQTAQCAGLRLGVCEVYDRVAADCRAQWQWDVDGYVIEQAARGAITLPRTGQDPDATARDLADRLRSAAKPLGERLIAKCRDLWRDGQWLDRIVVCGGGADLFLDALRWWRPDCTPAEDRQWLNARGYLALAAGLAEAGGTGGGA